MTRKDMRYVWASVCAISLSSSLSDKSATVSVRRSGLEAPTLGAGTNGFCAIQASAIWAFGTPRAPASFAICL